jgi:hypothetical protein
MLPTARLGPHAHQDRDEAPRETVRRLYVLPRHLIEVLRLPRMQNLGGN